MLIRKNCDWNSFVDSTHCRTWSLILRRLLFAWPAGSILIELLPHILCILTFSSSSLPSHHCTKATSSTDKSEFVSSHPCLRFIPRVILTQARSAHHNKSFGAVAHRLEELIGCPPEAGQSVELPKDPAVTLLSRQSTNFSVECVTTQSWIRASWTETVTGTWLLVL